MKTTILLFLASTLMLSGVSQAKEKMIKDPLGTRCKASDLLTINSVSAPKLLSAMPYPNTSVQKDSKKYVAVKFSWDQGELMNDEIMITEKDVKKYQLKIGDKKYCLMSVSAD